MLKFFSGMSGSVNSRRAMRECLEIAMGDKVEFLGDLLSVELVPGLLGQIYDGLQNPLPKLAEECGFFLQRGVYMDPLPKDKEWEFEPVIKTGENVRRAD